MFQVEAVERDFQVLIFGKLGDVKFILAEKKTWNFPKKSYY